MQFSPICLKPKKENLTATQSTCFPKEAWFTVQLLWHVCVSNFSNVEKAPKPPNPTGSRPMEVRPSSDCYQWYYDCYSDRLSLSIWNDNSCPTIASSLIMWYQHTIISIQNTLAIITTLSTEVMWAWLSDCQTTFFNHEILMANPPKNLVPEIFRHTVCNART